VAYGTALLLNSLKKDLVGGVKFLFQPAEEQPPGGASAMIKEGVLKNPDVKMIYGLHVDPTLPTGKISLRDGAVMASVIDFDIIILGRGGHAALPHRAVDAVAVAAELVGSIQKIVSRETNPLKPVVITFGAINGGTVRNVIAEKVVLSGTARTLDSGNSRALPRLLKRTISGICQARGAKFELNILSGYPVLENHAGANKNIASAYAELFGGKTPGETPQTMGGEDFSYYLKKVPGTFFRLGVKNNKIKANKPWHSSHFIADERAIYYGTAVMSLALIRTLESFNR
jgi:amidohydrolase